MLLYSRPALVVWAILLAFLVHASWGMYEKALLSYENRSRVENEYRELKERERELLSGIERLKTREGVESEIRKRYGFAKNGEEVVVIVDGPDTRESSPDDNPPRASWWDAFFAWLR